MDTSTYCKGRIGVSGKPVPCCVQCLRRTDPPAGKVLWLHQPRVSYLDGVWSCKDQQVHSDLAASENCAASDEDCAASDSSARRTTSRTLA